MTTDHTDTPALRLANQLMATTQPINFIKGYVKDHEIKNLARDLQRAHAVVTAADAFLDMRISPEELADKVAAYRAGEQP